MKASDISRVESAMDVIGSKCALPIVASLLESPKRFSQLQNHCDVCPRTLSARLDEMIINGLIKKQPAKNSLASQYQLTAKGQKLQPLVAQIIALNY